MGLALRERTALRTPKRQTQPQTFSSVDEAAKKIHGAMVGESPVKLASVRILVERNLVSPAQVGQQPPRWGWRYDGKLKPRGVLSPSEEQVLVAIADLRCPVLLIEGEKGFLRARYGGARKTQELGLRKATFKNLQTNVLPGAGHYPHMDEAPVVADLILNFVRKSVGWK